MKKFYTKRFSLICAFAASALLLAQWSCWPGEGNKKSAGD